MSESELSIEDNPSTPFLTNILILVFGFHVFPWEYTLLEFKVYAILTQNFWEDLTLHLLNVVKYGVSENEIAFNRRMRMQIQIHK